MCICDRTLCYNRTSGTLFLRSGWIVVKEETIESATLISSPKLNFSSSHGTGSLSLAKIWCRSASLHHMTSNFMSLGCGWGSDIEKPKFKVYILGWWGWKKVKRTLPWSTKNFEFHRLLSLRYLYLNEEKRYHGITEGALTPSTELNSGPTDDILPPGQAHHDRRFRPLREIVRGEAIIFMCFSHHK